MDFEMQLGAESDAEDRFGDEFRHWLKDAGFADDDGAAGGNFATVDPYGFLRWRWRMRRASSIPWSFSWEPWPDGTIFSETAPSR